MPYKPKYPCGVCDQAVRWKTPAVACDDCNVWFHKNCVHISTPVFNYLTCDPNASWRCPTCGIPQFTSSYFESTYIDSDSSLPTNNESTESADSNVTSPIGLPSACSSPNEENPPIRVKKTPLPTNLCVLVINCRKLTNKVVEFWNILETAKPGIVILTETWLNLNISNHEIFPPQLDYEVYRRDRPDGWGGVAIGIGPGLDGKLLHEAKDCEALFVEIDLELNGTCRRESLVVGAAYRPPSSSLEYMDCLCNVIQDVTNKNNKSILWLGGDFNLPDIDWKTFAIVGHQYPRAISENFISTMTATGLDQVVNFPTRLDNTLDLFLTNRPSCINKCQPIPGISDHEIVFVDTDIKPRRRKPVKRKIFLWDKADMNVLHEEGNKMMQEFVSKFDSSSSVTEMWDYIESKLANILELVPSKFTSTRFNQPWVTRKVKQLSRQKQCAYSKACSCRRQHKKRLWARYNILKKKMQRVCKDAYSNYINNIICPDLQSNPKRFWSHISSKRLRQQWSCTPAWSQRCHLHRQ